MSKKKKPRTLAARVSELESRLAVLETTLHLQTITEVMETASKSLEKLLSRCDKADAITDG